MNKKADIIILFGFIALAFIASLTLQLRFLPSAFFFFVLPTIYLFSRRSFAYTKIFVSATLLGLLASFLDAVITFNRGWWLPQEQLVFPWRVLGIWNVDNVIWYIFLALFIISFYEYFLGEERKVQFSSRFYRFWFFPFLIAGLLVSFFYLLPHEFLSVRYAYLTIASLSMLPPLIYLLFHKSVTKLLGKFSLVAAYFFFVSFASEIAGLKTGQWQFPGEYIGTVHVAGVVIPLEEFMFYFVISAFSALAYYEIFVDDMK